jgi:formimidoylglutamate deiminase
MTDLFFDSALLEGGWARDVRVSVDSGGWITALDTDTTPRGATSVAGVAVPGVPDVHSHAFQRALAGLTERGSARGDTFWTWRERMYAFLERLDPPAVEAIAGRLYAELLRHGFTSVAEFHYLRNDASGRAYDDPVEMARRLIGAADRTGMGITILPTVYRAGDFGGQAPLPGQRRFTASVEDLIGDVAVLGAEASPATVRVGLALHSLRAVPPADLAVAVEAVRGMDPEIPIHIHVAEQLREVEACVAWSGARPVAWLLDHAPVDATWCLIHATHVDAGEVEGMARSGAVVGLCPTTEANLGDGVFPFADFVEAGGRWSVGTDSHVGRSPVGELRMLEYGQRLTTRSRNVAAGPHARSTGRSLLEGTWVSGARACGRRVGRLAIGYRADIVVLDADHPSLLGRQEDDLLDSWIFSGDETPVRHVLVGGRAVVRDGRHVREDEIAEAFRPVAVALGGDGAQLALDLEE